MMAERIRVLIADDSSHVRRGLRALLTTWPHIEVIGEAVNGAEAVRQVGELQPDVVLMDLKMPVLHGLEATRILKRWWSATGVVVLTVDGGQHAAASAAGADTVLVKGCTSAQLLAALGVVRGGDEDEWDLGDVPGGDVVSL